jgi:hypothetical protein
MWMRLPGGRPVFLERLMVLVRIDSPLAKRFQAPGGPAVLDFGIPGTIPPEEQGDDGHR